MSEVWSFIPPNLLSKLNNITHSTHPANKNHAYFVDGPITVADVWWGSGDGTSKNSLLQFHGDDPPDFCTQFGVMTMKAFRVRDADSRAALRNYPTDAWLLDNYAQDKRGGTGATFNWDLAIEAQKLGKPVFLAGGLTPENVAAAVQRVQPFGVDVSSGVESSPGKKDSAKVRAFITATKAAAGP